MISTSTAFEPPFCPNPSCFHHRTPTGWQFKKKGFFTRTGDSRRIQRYLCFHCLRSFCDQTFSSTYWLKKPRVEILFHRILACSAYRQIARELDLSHTTVLRQVERIGRHCLLFHQRLRPSAPDEPLVIDGFETFEFSQYFPMHLNIAVGAKSHFVYGFTDSELRRKGRMTLLQKRRRAELEAQFGRPDPKSIQKGIATLVDIVVPQGRTQEIHSDEHKAYPRALQSLHGRKFVHRITSSKKTRTPWNPLFPANLIDLLVRHGSANHKRETIAFSKRRQSAIYRLAVLIVWRNYIKSVSERKRDPTPAQRLGILLRRLTVSDVLKQRLFPSLVPLPERWLLYYEQKITTRCIPNIRTHSLRYAY